jgi:hypothetical protein
MGNVKRAVRNAMTAADRSTLKLDDDYNYADPNLIDYQGRLAHLRDTKGVARLPLGAGAKRYPLRVITQMLGIPREDEDQLASWAHAMLRTLTDPDTAKRANDEFTRYVVPRRRRHGLADARQHDGRGARASRGA